jgi:hypothetical protein
MAPPTDYVLHVVSVDIVIDPVWGDASAEQTRAYTGYAWRKTDSLQASLQALRAKRGQEPEAKRYKTLKQDDARRVSSGLKNISGACLA